MKNFLFISFVVSLFACGNEGRVVTEQQTIPDEPEVSLLVPTVTKTLRFNCLYMEERIIQFEGFEIHISCFDIPNHERNPYLTVVADLQLIHETEE